MKYTSNYGLKKPEPLIDNVNPEPFNDNAEIIDLTLKEIQNQVNNKAPTNHNHSADAITSGTLPLSRGGLGTSDATIARKNINAANAIATLATNVDPNTVEQTLVVTNHANTPTGGGTYWYIQTVFYSELNANRAQIAVQYTGGNVMYTRNCYNGVWTTWARILSEHGGNLAGNLVAAAGTDYGTTKLRNSYFSTVVPSSMNNGEVCFVYE